MKITYVTNIPVCAAFLAIGLSFAQFLPIAAASADDETSYVARYFPSYSLAPRELDHVLRIKPACRPVAEQVKAQFASDRRAVQLERNKHRSFVRRLRAFLFSEREFVFSKFGAARIKDLCDGKLGRLEAKILRGQIAQAINTPNNVQGCDDVYYYSQYVDSESEGCQLEVPVDVYFGCLRRRQMMLSDFPNGEFAYLTYTISLRPGSEPRSENDILDSQIMPGAVSASDEAAETLKKLPDECLLGLEPQEIQFLREHPGLIDQIEISDAE